MRIVSPWLQELVDVPGDPDLLAREIALRGFEVAAVEHGHLPVIDFEITANRPDCLSHLGIAREAATIWRLALRMPETDSAPREASEAAAVEVRLDDEDLCPRYCAQVFDVTVGPSPAWLAERLAAAGVRSISNVVDITNYVLLEIGQPMHAFDLDRIGDRTLVIRRARAAEVMTTLDGIERKLEPEMLVIADGSRPLAVGGVMGGRDSEINATTTRIVLESAYFHPPSIRRTSKRLSLKTEASIRFERGGDILAAPLGIARAAALLRQTGAGRPVGPLIDRFPSPRRPLRLALRADRIVRVLGTAVPRGDVPRILTTLGFDVETGDPEVGDWRVTVPSFRADVSREIDLIEEVGRHHGFDRVPVSFPALTAPQAAPDPAMARERRVRRVLQAAGFSEAVTFAFIEREAALPFCEPGVPPAAIANPLSEKFAALRPSLLPGLLDACVHNRRRDRKDVRLFETGSRFAAAGEGRTAAFAWCGAASPPHWSGTARTVDFFDAKGLVDQIAAAAGIAVDIGPAEHGFLTPGRAAEARAGAGAASRTFARFGQLAPAIAEARGFPGGEDIYVAEIELAVVVQASGEDFRAVTLPRFPAIVRDLSLLVDEALPAAAVRDTIRATAPASLASLMEFDRYQGQGVPEGRISLSLRLTFRAPDRTLTDHEAQAATDLIVEALSAAHGAERR